MRVTGGRLTSRVLQAPRGHDTRPTSDRVREALFSILASRGRIEGARVLDLYAGTGSLGIEALSRGAVQATFVERARPALRALEANLAALGLASEGSVLAEPVPRALAQLAEKGARYELVFADPPYAELDAAAASLARLPDVLGEGATVVLEHRKDDASPALEGLILEGERRYGDTALSFYRA
jgi:16S rRNA (guanine(966)-N(2))-methyltransferase RsmD